jgi:SulP family sulfate permease
VTVLLLTPLFKTLPEAVLAALIIHALWHILVARKLIAIRALSHTEFWLGWIAFAGVVLYDVLAGMLIGLVASTLLMVYRSSRPHLAVLGRAPGVSSKYEDVERHPESAPVPGVLIVRLDAPLYYANALTVFERVLEAVAAADPKPRAVVFDATAVDSLDITSAEMLEKLVTKLRAEGIELVVAEVHAPVLTFARQTGLLESLGESHIYPTVDAAARALETQRGMRASPQ